MKKLNWELLSLVKQQVEKDMLFSTLENAWEGLVDEQHFNYPDYPEPFTYADPQSNRDMYEHYEDDGNVHVHLGDLHLGVHFGQEHRLGVQDVRKVAKLGRDFARLYAEEVVAYQKVVEQALQKAEPKNKVVVEAQKAVDKAEKELAKAQLKLERALKS